jgi:protein TonB
MHLLAVAALLLPGWIGGQAVRFPVGMMPEAVYVRLVAREPEPVPIAPQAPPRVQVKAKEAKVSQAVSAGKKRRVAARRLREETVSLNAGPRKYRGYLARIRSAIERSWRLESGESEGDLTVLFSVSRDGGLSGVGLIRSSGSSALDASALAAIKRAGPFPPMPPGMDLARLNVKANFCLRLASKD